jgi:hypothetical protein
LVDREADLGQAAFIIYLSAKNNTNIGRISEINGGTVLSVAECNAPFY